MAEKKQRWSLLLFFGLDILFFNVEFSNVYAMSFYKSSLGLQDSTILMMIPEFCKSHLDNLALLQRKVCPFPNSRVRLTPQKTLVSLITT